MIPNLIWTALFLIPVAVFCYTCMPYKGVFISLGISMFTVFLPNSFYDRLQLSKDPRFYKKIGIKQINYFAQNGKLLNEFLKKKYPNYKVVMNTRASIKKQYYQTYFFEKFHFSLFIFFAIATVYAGMQEHFYWVIVLLLSNLLYNVYPNLLQQYVRLKLKSAITDKR
jgi:hypothetical protein